MDMEFHSTCRRLAPPRLAKCASFLTLQRKNWSADVVVGAHTSRDRQALVSLHVPDLGDAAASHVIDPPGP
jgi:hypothetical protein